MYMLRHIWGCGEKNPCKLPTYQLSAKNLWRLKKTNRRSASIYWLRNFVVFTTLGQSNSSKQLVFFELIRKFYVEQRFSFWQMIIRMYLLVQNTHKWMSEYICLITFFTNEFLNIFVLVVWSQIIIKYACKIQ